MVGHKEDLQWIVEQKHDTTGKDWDATGIMIHESRVLGGKFQRRMKEKKIGSIWVNDGTWFTEVTR
jgi:hypothetical protein